MAGRKAYEAFLAKWTTLCPAVARSLEEAGSELLTFYAFPKSMWRSLRTTNPLENLNREFRRRTKTAGIVRDRAGGRDAAVRAGCLRADPVPHRSTVIATWPACCARRRRTQHETRDGVANGRDAALWPRCNSNRARRSDEEPRMSRSAIRMGPLSERSHAASRNAITPRRLGLTTGNRLRYTSSTEATPELFHGTRDTTRDGAPPAPRQRQRPYRHRSGLQEDHDRERSAGGLRLPADHVHAALPGRGAQETSVRRTGGAGALRRHPVLFRHHERPRPLVPRSRARGPAALRPREPDRAAEGRRPGAPRAGEHVARQLGL